MISRITALISGAGKDAGKQEFPGKGGTCMSSKVAVTIGGRDFTLVVTDEAGYVQKVANYVDQKVGEIIEQSKVSLTDAALLAALNLADEYFKANETAENLRRQLREYLEEASRTKMELSDLKRQLARLQNGK
jgi:cell division protein ZapA